MKRPIAEREQIVSAFVKKELGKEQAAQLLGCTKRTLETYVKQYVVYKTAGPKRNFIKLKKHKQFQIISLSFVMIPSLYNMFYLLYLKL